MTIEEANVPEDRQRCEGTVVRWGYGISCFHVATVTTADGKRLCLDRAKKAAK